MYKKALNGNRKAAILLLVCRGNELKSLQPTTQVIVVIAAVMAVIIYRIVISSVFAYQLQPDKLGSIGSYATPSLLTTVTGSCLSLVVIMALNNVSGRGHTSLTSNRVRGDHESFTTRP